MLRFLVAAFDAEADDPAAGLLHRLEALFRYRVDAAVAAPADLQAARQKLIAQVHDPFLVPCEGVGAEEEIPDAQSFHAVLDLIGDVLGRAHLQLVARGDRDGAVDALMRTAAARVDHRERRARVGRDIKVVPQKVPRGERKAVEVMHRDVRPVGVVSKAAGPAPGQAEDVGEAAALGDLLDGVLGLAADREVEVRVGQHDLLVLRSEMRALGDGDDAGEKPLGDAYGRQVAQDGRRRDRHHQHVGAELGDVFLDVVPRRLFGREVADLAGDAHALQHGGHVGEVERRAIGLGRQPFDGGLTTVVAYVKPGRRIDEKGAGYLGRGFAERGGRGVNQ